MVNKLFLSCFVILIGIGFHIAFSQTIITNSQITTPSLTSSGTQSLISHVTNINNLNLGNPQIIPASEVITINKTNSTTSYVDYNATNWNIIAQTNDIGKLLNMGCSALPANGGRIFITYGNFSLSTEFIYCKASVMIQGEGDGTSQTHGVTALWQANSVNLPAMVNFNALPNEKLRDIFLWGNKHSNINTDCLVTGGDNSEVDFIGVYNCPHIGINIVGGHAGFFAHDYSENNTSNGWVIDNTWATTFVQPYSATNQNFGFYLLDNARKNVFLGSKSQDDANDCYVLQAFSGGHGAVADYNSFSSPECISESFTNGQNGFRLLGAQHNSITGAIIHNPGQKTTNTYDAIQLALQGNRCACYNDISFAQIASTSANKIRYGINEADTSEGYNRYINNQITGAVTKDERIQNVTSISVGEQIENSKQFVINMGGNFLVFPIPLVNNTISTWVNGTADPTTTNIPNHSCEWFTYTNNNSTFKWFCNISGTIKHILPS